MVLKRQWSCKPPRHQKTRGFTSECRNRNHDTHWYPVHLSQVKSYKESAKMLCSERTNQRKRGFITGVVPSLSTSLWRVPRALLALPLFATQRLKSGPSVTLTQILETQLRNYHVQRHLDSRNFTILVPPSLVLPLGKLLQYLDLCTKSKQDREIYQYLDTTLDLLHGVSCHLLGLPTCSSVFSPKIHFSSAWIHGMSGGSTPWHSFV